MDINDIIQIIESNLPQGWKFEQYFIEMGAGVCTHTQINFHFRWRSDWRGDMYETREHFSVGLAPGQFSGSCLDVNAIIAEKVLGYIGEKMYVYHGPTWRHQYGPVKDLKNACVEMVSPITDSEMKSVYVAPKKVLLLCN
jgi:hypothetical protein